MSATTELSEYGQAALAYAADGHPVVPVEPGGKDPAPYSPVAEDGRRHAKDDATTDPDVIRRWWGEIPEAGVGVRVDEPYVVIDIDERNGGELSPKWPESRRTRTPNGWHIWYRDPRARNRGTIPGVPGVETIAEGKKYVVEPPSTRLTEEGVSQYEVESSAPIADLDTGHFLTQLQAEGEPDRDPLELRTWNEAFVTAPREGIEARKRHLFLVQGFTHTVRGHYGEGKTALLVDAARQWIDADEDAHVVWLDYELGEVELCEMMRDNGWKLDALTSRLHYGDYETFSEGELLRAVQRFGPEHTLVIIDSLPNLGFTLALEENQASDVGGWLVRNALPARNAGATIVAVDQERQQANRNDRYSRGTTTKGYAPDAVWYVEMLEKVDRHTVGRMRLTCKKGRRGAFRMDEEVHFRVGDGDGRLPFVPIDAADVPAEDGAPGGRRSVSRQAIRSQTIKFLRDQAPDREHALSATKIREHVQGNHARKAEVLTELTGDAAAPVESDPHAKPATVYWYEEHKPAHLPVT